MTGPWSGLAESHHLSHEFADHVESEEPFDTRLALIRAAPNVVEVGKSYETWWPYVREGSGWRPGFERIGDSRDEESFSWHGEGVTIFSIVSLHKPGPKYAERAIYHRSYRGPDGIILKTAKLHMVTAATIPKWLRGSKTDFLTGVQQ